MSQQIRIDPHYTTYYTLSQDGREIEVRAESDTPDFLRRVAEKLIGTPASQTKKNIILPKNCRFYDQDHSYHYIVLEEDPAFRTVFLSQDFKWAIEKLKLEGKYEEYGIDKWLEENKKSPYKFLLAFPYFIYVLCITKSFSLSELRIFVRTTPIRDFSDELCKVPLPNIGEYEGVCMGDTSESIRRAKTPLQAAEGYITSYWKNIFNDDLRENQKMYQKRIPELSDPFTWQHLSKQDPMFVYRVEWIKSNYQLGTVITQIGSSRRKERQKIHRYDFSRFVSSLRYNTVVQRAIEDDDEIILYDRVSDSKHFNDTLVYLGDQLQIKGKTYIINSFVGTHDDDISHVRLLREDDKRILMKLNRKTTSFLESKILEKRHVISYVVEDVTYNRGDYVAIDLGYGEVFRKIEYFKYGGDGNLELRTRSGLYPVKAFANRIRKLDLENIEVDGTVLKQDHPYLISNLERSYRYSRCALYKRAVEATYVGPNVGDTDLVLEFRKSNMDPYRIPIKEMTTKYRVKSGQDLPKTPKRMRAGNTIYKVLTGDRIIDSHALWDGENGLLLTNTQSLSHENSLQNIVDDCFFDDKETFFMFGLDGLDLKYSVGDKVVCCDWHQDPMNMLKVKTITGFSIQTEGGPKYIKLILRDKDEALSDFDLVKQEPNEGNYIIHHNRIRHIDPQYKDLKAGMKIKAAVAGISGFPKKDTNVIIGFLPDTGTDVPLVLCSNCLTLWADEVEENFEIYPMDYPKWTRMQIAAYDEKRFKFQNGDRVIIGNNRLALLVKHPYTSQIHVQYDYRHGHSSAGVFSLDSYHRRRMNHDGFILPRYTERQLRSRNLIFALATGMGSFVRDDDAKILFYVDPRRLISR